MKKNKVKIIIFSAIIFILVSVIAVCVYVRFKSAALPEDFTVTAHTGCEDTTDNSLESITVGYEKGADIVEFDLNFTEDGTAVLAHDNAEPNSVTLDEAFDLIAELEGLRVNVDAKSTDNLYAVESLAKKHGVMDRIFYTGIEEQDIEAVKAQTPDITYWLNFKPDVLKTQNREYLESLAQKTAELGAVGINLSHVYCTKELVDVFHENGLLVSIWTVNNKFEMVRAVELGADNITTRQPSILAEIISDKTE